MSAGKVKDGALQKTDTAVKAINDARNALSELQKQYAPHQAAYLQCDSIDDKLFEALVALGDN